MFSTYEELLQAVEERRQEMLTVEVELGAPGYLPHSKPPTDTPTTAAGPPA